MKSETTTRPLRELVRGFNSGTILLPQFQRDYVWRSAKIRNLLDSLLKGFPVGGFYLWRPPSGTRDPKPKSFGEQKFAPEFSGYLIDGQQRLTSLEAAFGLYTGEDKNGAVLRCYLDLSAVEAEAARDTRLFVSYAGNKSVARRVEDGDSTLVDVAKLFDGRDYDLRREIEDALRRVPRWDAKRVGDALDRFDRCCEMLDQQVPCTTISDVEDKEAVEVFSRLNKGGSALRQGDVRAAELARGHAVDVLKDMRTFVTQDRPQRIGFGFSFAFRALVVFHRESAQFNRLKPDWMDTAGPNSRNLAQSWNAAQRAIEVALEFVDTEMGWSRRALLPSANALIVVAAALDKSGTKLDDESRRNYRQWLCLTALRGVFQGSVETTINRFHRAIRESNRGASRSLVDALKRDERRPIRAEELNKSAHLWGPATQVMHAWLVGRDATDWLSGDTIDGLARAKNPTAPGGDLTVHHIFSRKAIDGMVDNKDEANNPANFALLSRSTNSAFGDKRPDEVFRELSSDARKRAGIQFFGDAAGDHLRLERYKEFCHWRAERLAESINDWLGLD